MSIKAASSAFLQLVESDQRAEILFLLKAQPWDIAGGKSAWVGFSEHGFTTSGDEALADDENRHFDGVMTLAFAYEREVWQAGAVGGTSAPHEGSARLANPTGALDSYADPALYYWPGCTVQVWVGTRGMAFSDFQLVMTGTAKKWVGGTLESELIFSDLQLLLADAMNLPRYRGMDKALTLNGNTEYVRSTNVANQEAITFECRFRCTGANTAGTDQTIATHSSGAGAATTDWKVSLTSAGLLKVEVMKCSGSTQTYTKPTTDYRDSAWHDFALACYTGGTWTAWLDGVKLTTGTSPGTFTQISTNMRIFFGGDVTLGNTRFKGDLDELRLWSAALADDEIPQSMDRPLTSEEVSNGPGGRVVRVYWRCDEGSGTTCNDTGNAGSRSGTHFPAAISYVKTGEGGAESAGLTKPACFGHCFEVQGWQTDPSSLVWDVHFGPIEDIVAAYDNGVALTLGVGWTKDTTKAQATLLAAISKTGPITFEVKGDKPSGTYLSTLGKILRRVTTAPLGPLADPAQIDTAAFTAIDTAAPDELGFYIPPGPKAPSPIEVADAVAGSALAGYWFTREGLLTVAQWSLPTAPEDLAVNAVDILDVEPIELWTPQHNFAAGYQRNNTVREEGQIGGTVQGTARAKFLSSEYRYVRKRRQLQIYEKPQPDRVSNSTHATEAGAGKLATIEKDLYGTARRAWRITAKTKLYLLEPFSKVLATWPRHGLESGVLCKIVAMTEDSKRKTVTMEVIA